MMNVSVFLYKHNTTWKVVCTVFMHLCLCIRDLTCSLGALVLLVHQQLVRKYHTHTLSMEYYI